MQEYLDRLQNAAAAAQALGWLTSVAGPLLASWLGYKALRLALSAGRRALARLLPGPSELCRELLAALDGEAVYDPRDRGGSGSLCTDGVLIVFDHEPKIETPGGWGCEHHLSRREKRRVMRKAYALRDRLEAEARERARARRAAEVRLGRTAADGINAARPRPVTWAEQAERDGLRG